MPLSVRDVQRDPIANRALTELVRDYTVAEAKSGLVLSKNSGNLKLFFNELDDLHQWEFVQNRLMVSKIERLRALMTKIHQQRESWKVRALMAEAQLLETTTRTSNNGNPHGSEVRYLSLKRYLAKQFHPDHAPGDGVEKAVRNEIFKEIWSEIERLDERVSTARWATPRPR
jgi:phage/plasmid-associated DNA primase